MEPKDSRIFQIKAETRESDGDALIIDLTKALIDIREEIAGVRKIRNGNGNGRAGDPGVSGRGRDCRGTREDMGSGQPANPGRRKPVHKYRRGGDGTTDNERDQRSSVAGNPAGTGRP
jgi:hypothetical protein